MKLARLCIQTVFVCLFPILWDAHAAQPDFEKVETAAPPNLPTAWATNGTGATWSTTNATLADADKDAGGNVFAAALTSAQPGSRWLIRGPYEGSSRFCVDAWLRTPDLPPGCTITAEVALAHGTALPSPTDFTNVVGLWTITNTNVWQHYGVSVPAADVPPFWTNRTDIYVGFRVCAGTNTTAWMDGILIGDGYFPRTNEGFLSEVLSRGWHARWLSSSAYNWAESSARNAPDSMGGSMLFNSAYASVNSRARLTSRNLIDHGGREVVVFDFSTYNESSTRNDWIQPVLSTNDWATTIDIGSALPRYVATESANSWIRRSVTNYVPGIGAASSVRAGLLAVSSTSGGSSGKNIVVDDLEIDFITDLFLGEPSLCTDIAGVNPLSVLTYTNVFYVTVDVTPRPPDQIEIDACRLVYWTNDGTITNDVDLARYGTTDRYVAAVSESPLEAGQQFNYRVICDYTLLGTGQTAVKMAPAGSTPATSTVQGVGSVWINEAALAGGVVSNQFIELAAPRNREIDGWSLQVIDWLHCVTNSLGDIEYSFTDDANGFGFWMAGGTGIAARDRDMTFQLPMNCGIRLLNRAGLVEDSVALGSITNIPGYRITCSGDALALQGYAALEEGGLHTGFAGEFSVTCPATSTPGYLNDEQGFLVPVTITADAKVLDEWDESALNAASVTLEALFHGGVVSTQTISDVSGNVGPITLQGLHSQSNVMVRWVANAFGYSSLTSLVEVVTGTGENQTMTMRLPGGPGIEPFEGTSFMPYWFVTKAQSDSAVWAHGESRSGAYKGPWAVFNAAYVAGIE
ncbi:MAG: hypothetical protein PHR35_15215, partial [Kiritimatiellae bacterium]|nr:hypothetical protein [Kiritimatiellia bacterium]